VQLPSFDYRPQPYSGTPFETVVADRKNYVPQFAFHYYAEPLLMVEGRMQYLFDHKGRRFQDWISGIATVSIGHSHPAVVRAVTEQSRTLCHTTQVMLNNVQAVYAQQLCEKLGGDFDSVYFCNSGSEANDFAINLARVFTHKHHVLSIRNSYHGLVGSAGSVTNMAAWSGNMLRGSGFEKLAWPSKYNGLHQSVEALRRDAMEVIAGNCNGHIAALIIEPIQGIGGINTFVDGYAPMVASTVRSFGGLIICDEVQTGFGRIGTQYWGHRLCGFKPDIVTVAKGIANGLPLGAVVTRREVAKAMDYTFFNTTGGGPVQCRAATEVLKAIDREQLAQNAETVGAYLLTELRRIAEATVFVGDVRGAGLMIGIEIVKDKATKEPSKELCNQILEKLRERQMLIGRGGAGANVLRLQPPLCMSMDDAKYFVHHFEAIAKELK
jgi:alanine-glyoxylate transaminase/(R)-3-amino-2-methylpropionate-pyruvate transaminase